MWYQDLTPFIDLGPECAASVLAVGWLERGKPYQTGPVDPSVYARLVELLKHPWEPALTLGFHRCDLCLYDGPPGKRNLYLPATGAVLVAPELVAHSMNAHGYRPPDEFCAAVLACPTMRSVSYFAALKTVAPSLVRLAGVPQSRAGGP